MSFSPFIVQEIKSIIATVQMRPLSGVTIGPSPIPSNPSSPPPGASTPQKEADAASPSISLSSLTNLDELDLSSARLPPSRPIGELDEEYAFVSGFEKRGNLEQHLF